MDLLNSLMGGGRERDQAQDFVTRYDRGAPYDGIGGDEAYQQYQRVAPHLSQRDYELSAEEAFSRMSPQERMQFAQMMSQQARQQGMQIQDFDHNGIDDRFQDPRYLAQTMGRVQQQQPNLFQQLMGGGGGMMGGAGAGNMLQNPLAKAALGGIAAMALRRMMNQQGGGGSPFGGGGISL